MIGLVAVVAAGVLGFILGKKSVQIPDVQARLMEQKLMFEQQLATVKESNEKQIEALKLMNREQVESQMKLIREQMQTTSEKVLRMREEQLGQTNREQVSKIMEDIGYPMSFFVPEY